MRKISRLAAEHFMKGEPFSMGNTKVIRRNDNVHLLLHGNIIARRVPTGLEYETHISICGYKTRTTIDRLNAIPKVNVCIRNGILYLNGLLWDGYLQKVS